MPAEVPGLDKHIGFLQAQEAEAHRDLAYTLLAIDLALADAELAIDRASNHVGVVQVFEAPGTEAIVARMFAMMAQGACPPGENPAVSAGSPSPNMATPAAPPGMYDLLAPSFYSSQAFFYVHLVGKAFGFHGFSTSVHNACSSGAYALELAAERIRSGRADVMLVAGGEAFETGVRLEWFRRMGMYACDGVMKPFSPASHGFYVGEGAGAIVLESAQHAVGRGAGVYGRYAGSAFAQQSWKQVVPDVASLRLAKVIEECLARANRSPDEIDVVVPHGAGSWISDGYEARCIELAWKNAPDRTVATVLKPYTGHMLGCSGVMETIGALIGMRDGRIFATPSVTSGECKLRLPVVDTLQNREVRTLLKISTGFTGHDAATLWERDP
jgi:3-oxoacyl-[acyl-carrier-protein] synthase II